MCDGVDDAFGNGISDLVSLLPYLLEDGGWKKVFFSDLVFLWKWWKLCLVVSGEVIGGYTRRVKIGLRRSSAPANFSAPARFTGGFYGLRSPTPLCGCRRSGYNWPGELEISVVEGGEQALEKAAADIRGRLKRRTI
ncbi:hypothetical protein Rs2_21965 [Raphanus sativus]|nr:hypothetical protein Rs2_21965 [Raphanus sativus]